MGDVSEAEAEAEAVTPCVHACKSLVYAWRVEDYYFAVHVVDHDEPMPSEALRVVAHLMNGVLTSPVAPELHPDMVVLHYVPTHKVIDLTLMNGDGRADGQVERFKAVAETEGIVPFLACFRKVLAANLSGDGLLLSGKSMVEIRYDGVADLATSRFTIIEHDFSRVSQWPRLQLLVDRCTSVGL